jgi:hypothetical protein
MTQPSRSIDRWGPLVFQWGAWAAIGYGVLNFVYQEHIGRWRIGWGFSLAMFILLGGIVALCARAFRVRTVFPPNRMLNVGLLMIGTVCGLFIVDVSFQIFTNFYKLEATVQYQARLDGQVWITEIAPFPRFPNNQGFQIYGPNTEVRAKTYGWMYRPAMLSSRTLVDTVLELRDRSYRIGSLGFRDLTPIGSARYFALGDSFVYGTAVGESEAWPTLLGNALGEHVYNMGVPGATPTSEVALLKYVMAKQADVLHIRHLVWMLYEGNDLLDAPLRPLPEPRHGLYTALSGSALQVLADFPKLIRNQSVLRKFLNGDLHLRREQLGIRAIDGVALQEPLFFSFRFGYKFFTDSGISEVTRSRAAVIHHRNLPFIDQAFRDLRILARQGGFSVTVVLAPCAERLHGPSFDGFPKLDPPHFLNWLSLRAKEEGFEVVNLLSVMQPFAEKELLHFRDDTHWNPRGHEVVAKLLRNAIPR